MKEYFYFTGGYGKAGIRSRFLIPIKDTYERGKGPETFPETGGRIMDNNVHREGSRELNASEFPKRYRKIT